MLKSSVTDTGMFIPDPLFPYRIPDPNCLHPGSLILKEFKYFNSKKTKKLISKL
jgi:hypothetical protein